MWEKAERYVIFLVGLFINSFGVSFITKANLGTSPISSIPYTLSLYFPFTIGEFTFVFNLLLIALQIIILRKNFKLEALLQIPVVFLFSYFIDLTMDILSFMTPSNYIMQFVSLLVGCLILGFGVYLEVLANVVMLPGEAFVNAISTTFNRDFGKTKIVFDSSMFVVAGVISFILFGKLNGVREGTVVAALVVGMIARFFQRKLSFVPKLIFVSEKLKDNNVISKVENPRGVIVTITREYGSSGHAIGRLLAKELNMDFYDKEIIDKAADVLDFSKEFVSNNEQRIRSGILQDFISQGEVYRPNTLPQDKLYAVEADIIKEMADKGNCVIVGRCADYILKNYKNCINIFLYGDDDSKTREIMKRENLDFDNAYKHMSTINRERYRHYKYYTGRDFGLSSNYNLSVDTGTQGVVNTVNIIKGFIKNISDTCC
jgi:uncharacterized membrane protein YczE